MHPRNPYRTPPNFAALAEDCAELRPHLIQSHGGTTIDFHDAAALKCLTRALLRRDFGLELTMPDDRLCPPVPNRLNYILWLEDIMNHSVSEKRSMIGLDIGTGASAIYPLLGCATNQEWQFVATDIDVRSLEFARLNVSQNALDQRIRVVQVPASGPIFHESVLKIWPRIDFTMCNPPFYGDREEVLSSAEAKEFGPNAVCTGADNEMITPGGEVVFVSSMVKESAVHKAWCRWYSSMLGKMSSLTEIVSLLRELKIGNYAITEFVQGRTRRWAIAWSFTDERLPDALTRITNPALQTIMPSRNTLVQPFTSGQSLDDLAHTVRTVVANVNGAKLESEVSGEKQDSIVVHVPGDSWSRAARRKRLTGNLTASSAEGKPALSCRIDVRRSEQMDPADISTRLSPGGRPLLEFQWMQGVDRGLFESFMSHVSRKVEAGLKSSDVEMDL